MMTQAFYTGISGLQTFQSGIDTVSDNLANISTTGFRGYNTEFSSLFEHTLSTGSGFSDGVGIGTRVQATSMNTAMGSMMSSDKNTDLALMGDGWFGVTNNNDTFYTRSGNFSFDRDNSLVNGDGYYLLGTMGGNIGNGILNNVLEEVALGNVATQESMNFPNILTFPAQPTSTATFRGNLGTLDEVTSIGVGVVDGQGNRNSLKISFTKVVPQFGEGTQWDAVATTGTRDGNTIYDTQSGRVDFDAKGAIVSNALSSINNNGSQVTLDLGEGWDGLVAMSNVPISASSMADGIISGDLAGYEVDRNAEVIATFSNGMQSSVGKVAVYHFMNEQGLEREGGTRFSESANSGDAFFYKDENGQNVIGTSVANYNLESSNVRMDVALTDLIIYQRAYDANSKSITTADEMMQKALSMDA